jgi:MFS family permease
MSVIMSKNANEKVEMLDANNIQNPVPTAIVEEKTQTSEKLEEILKDHQESMTKDYKHNAITQVSSCALFGLGYPFTVWATIGITYMTSLGAPKTLIGVIQASWPIFGVFQLVATKFFTGRPRKNWVSWLYFSSTVPLVCYGIISLLQPQLFSRSDHICYYTIAMLFSIGVSTIMGAVSGSLTIDFTPIKKRGSLFGYGVAATALTLLAMSPVVSCVMNHWPEPKNYCISLLIGYTLISSSTLLWLLFREYSDPLIMMESKKKKASNFWGDLFAELRSILQNRQYRVFIFFVMVATAAFTVGPFIMVFGKEKLNLTGSQVVIFTVLSSASGALFSYILGKIADGFGYRIIAILQGILAAIGFSLMLMLSLKQSPNIILLYLAFVIYAGVMGSSALILVNMSIELMPKHHSGNMIAITNLLLMPVGFVAPGIGIILDTTRSYFTVFIIGGILALLSVVGFAIFIKEPRKQVAKAVLN